MERDAKRVPGLETELKNREDAVAQTTALLLSAQEEVTTLRARVEGLTAERAELAAKQQAQASSLDAALDEALGGSAAGSALDAARRRQHAGASQDRQHAGGALSANPNLRTLAPKDQAAMAEARRVAAHVVEAGRSVAEAVREAEEAADAVRRKHVAARRAALAEEARGGSPSVVTAVEAATLRALLENDDSSSGEGEGGVQDTTADLAASAVVAAAEAAKRAAQAGMRPELAREAAAAAWRATRAHSDSALEGIGWGGGGSVRGGDGAVCCEAAEAAADVVVSLLAGGVASELASSMADEIASMVASGGVGASRSAAVEVARLIATDLALDGGGEALAAELGAGGEEISLADLCARRARDAEAWSGAAAAAAVADGSGEAGVEAAARVAELGACWGCPHVTCLQAAEGMAAALSEAPPGSQQELDAAVDSVVAWLKERVSRGAAAAKAAADSGPAKAAADAGAALGADVRAETTAAALAAVAAMGSALSADAAAVAAVAAARAVAEAAAAAKGSSGSMGPPPMFMEAGLAAGHAVVRASEAARQMAMAMGCTEEGVAAAAQAAAEQMRATGGDATSADVAALAAATASASGHTSEAASCAAVAAARAFGNGAAADVAAVAGAHAADAMAHGALRYPALAAGCAAACAAAMEKATEASVRAAAKAAASAASGKRAEGGATVAGLVAAAGAAASDAISHGYSEAAAAAAAAAVVRQCLVTPATISDAARLEEVALLAAEDAVEACELARSAALAMGWREAAAEAAGAEAARAVAHGDDVHSASVMGMGGTVRDAALAAALAETAEVEGRSAAAAAAAGAVVVAAAADAADGADGAGGGDAEGGGGVVPSLDARVAIELGKAAVAAVEAAEATPGTSLLTALGDGLSVARAMRRKLEPGVQIPGWTLEGWLGSLDLTGLVARAITEKLHARVAQAGGGSAGEGGNHGHHGGDGRNGEKNGERNGFGPSEAEARSVELHFVSALGKAPTAGICEALLEQASASRLLADRIHEAARELHRERKEAEERAARERREAQGSILRAMAPSVAPDTSQGSAAAADGDGSWWGSRSRRQRFIAYSKEVLATLSSEVQVLDAESLNAQFANNSIELFFQGDLEYFWRGLEKVLGKPTTELALRDAMAAEHNAAVDSEVWFETPNYKIKTTSRIEWHFVAHANDGLERLGMARWPPMQAPERTDRVARPLAMFEAGWVELNGRLTEAGEQLLSEAEFVALRLYTGPLFVKYNAVLRGTVSTVVPLINHFRRVCMGHLYPTTLHILSAAIIKCSKVQSASVVYRAPGGALPKSFWRLDAYGVRGGIEPAFLSTTTSKEEAMHYAKRSPSKVIFELHQGMVARGASISWLSQHPAEAEVQSPAVLPPFLLRVALIHLPKRATKRKPHRSSHRFPPPPSRPPPPLAPRPLLAPRPSLCAGALPAADRPRSLQDPRRGHRDRRRAAPVGGAACDPIGMGRREAGRAEAAAGGQRGAGGGARARQHRGETTQGGAVGELAHTRAQRCAAGEAEPGGGGPRQDGRGEGGAAGALARGGARAREGAQRGE